MKTNLKEITVILGVACIVAALYNTYSVAGVPYIYVQEKVAEGAVVTVEQARDMVDDKEILFIDARPTSSYKIAHLPGAICIPYSSKELEKLISDIKKDQSIVVYCYSSRCNMARMLISRLNKLGYNKTALFDEGISVWQMHKYPVESSIKKDDGDDE